MKTFVDTVGRTWNVVLNVATLRRVRDLIQVDLMDVIGDGGKLLTRLAADPVLLCDVLYVLCRPQAEAQAVTDVQFGEAMAGDGIEQASTALLEELAGFFPTAKATVLRKVLEKLRALDTMATDQAAARLDDPATDAALRAALAGGSSGASSTNGPASSASIPPGSPSLN